MYKEVDDMKINEQIRKYRKAAGLTQEQIAEYLGVTTPAVSKWENGITFPDITLLPALARLLKTDLDTLFSFHGSLTDVEVEDFIHKLATMSQDNPDEAFEMASQKIQEYPKSDNLLLSAANILNASLLLSPMEAEKKQAYEALVVKWLERAAESSDVEIKNAAVAILLGKVMETGDYDRASSLLAQLPQQQFDKTPYEANILINRGKLDEAAVLLESRLLQSLFCVQTYCLKLLEVELKCNHPDQAHQIGEIIEKMIPLFGLWQYGTVVPRLQTALYEKDEERSLTAIKEMMAAVGLPWTLSDSPLFYRIADGTVKNAGKTFIPALISELKSSAEFDFLRNNAEFQEFLTRLDGDKGTPANR